MDDSKVVGLTLILQERETSERTYVTHNSSILLTKQLIGLEDDNS